MATKLNHSSISVSYEEAIQNYEERGTFGFGDVEDDDRLCRDNPRCCRRGKCLRRTLMASITCDVCLLA